MLGCGHTLPAHIELLIHEHPQVLILRAALSAFSAQPVFVLGIASAHLQDLALGLVELEVQGSHSPTSEVCQGAMGAIPSLKSHNFKFTMLQQNECCVLTMNLG